eukprot:GHVP01063539.1.p1 GENE.GHVP01063539.1~~GHVP01063539.1.p1  ORF type:complete len:501 (-),score=93.70 GHVP01063539.1:204-1706(-)
MLRQIRDIFETQKKDILNILPFPYKIYFVGFRSIEFKKILEVLVDKLSLDPYENLENSISQTLNSPLLLEDMSDNIFQFYQISEDNLNLNLSGNSSFFLISEESKYEFKYPNYYVRLPKEYFDKNSTLKRVVRSAFQDFLSSSLSQTRLMAFLEWQKIKKWEITEDGGSEEYLCHQRLLQNVAHTLKEYQSDISGSFSPNGIFPASDSVATQIEKLFSTFRGNLDLLNFGKLDEKDFEKYQEEQFGKFDETGAHFNAKFFSLILSPRIPKLLPPLLWIVDRVWKLLQESLKKSCNKNLEVDRYPLYTKWALAEGFSVLSKYRRKTEELLSDIISIETSHFNFNQPELLRRTKGRLELEEFVSRKENMSSFLNREIPSVRHIKSFVRKRPDLLSKSLHINSLIIESSNSKKQLHFCQRYLNVHFEALKDKLEDILRKSIVRFGIYEGYSHIENTFYALLATSEVEKEIHRSLLPKKASQESVEILDSLIDSIESIWPKDEN